MALEEKFKDNRDNFLRNVEPIFRGDAEFLRLIQANVRKAYETANSAAVLECVSRYAEAEIDHFTPGDGGLGRVSSAIPRYGAHFRRSLTKLPPARLHAVRGLVVDTIMVGYFSHVAAAEESVLQSNADTADQLFNLWVPVIYSSALTNSFTSDTLQIAAAVSDWNLTVHTAMLVALSIRKSGLLRPNQTEQILRYQSLAGFALRALETRRAGPEPAR